MTTACGHARPASGRKGKAARTYIPAGVEAGSVNMVSPLLPRLMSVKVKTWQPLTAITTLAVVVALFGLGGWAFHDMYQFPFGPQLVVVPGPGGTVELKPGPGVMTGGPGRVAPADPGSAPWRPATETPTS